MAAVQALYAESINFSTTSPHTTYRDACSISGASFTGSNKYLILVSGFMRENSSANEALVRLNATGVGLFETAIALELTTTTQKANFGYMFVYTQPSTPVEIVLQIANSSTTATTLEWGAIVAINLDDFGVSGTDYHFNEVTADYTTTTSYVSQASVTFTPNGTDDYLVVANGIISGVNTATNHMMRINDSVAGALTTIDVEGEDATNEVRGYLTMAAITPSAASHTISAQFAHETPNAVSVLTSRIFAINLNKFRNHAIVRTAASQQPAATPTWTTTQTLSPTPDVTGNWFIWGYLGNDVGTNTDNMYVRLQVNASGSGLASNPAYGDNSPGIDGWDPTDITPINIFTLTSLTSGASRVINFDATMNSGTTLRVIERSLVAFSLELPSAGGVLIPAFMQQIRAKSFSSTPLQQIV